MRGIGSHSSASFLFGPTPCGLSDSPPKRRVPERDDAVTKRADGRSVCRNGMVREKAGYDLAQPLALLWDWLVSLAQQRFFDFLDFARMRSRRVFLLRRNLPRRDFPQISVKPRKSNVSGFPRPRLARLVAAWRPRLDETRVANVPVFQPASGMPLIRWDCSP